MPARAYTLDIYRRVLRGTFYDNLRHAFHDERNASGEYVPIKDRRPSVRYPLAAIVVGDALAMVFGDGRFPTVACDDKPTAEMAAALVRATQLNAVMAEAGLRGSIGSVALLMAVVSSRVMFRVMETINLTPEFAPTGEVAKVTERYKVPAADLAARGYAIDPKAGDHWFQRVWDADAETWFLPWPVKAVSSEPVIPQVDEARTVTHGLGFCPIVWVRNLPGGDDPDGDCTFRSAIETGIEIDYQLSQAGRGLKYSSDPLLLLKEPAAGDGVDIIRSASNAITVNADGDAKLLEISGTASAAVIEYVRTLREFALEGVHGNRSSPEKLTGAQSGRALEMMNQGLIWLADQLRVSYGGALLELVRMVAKASAKVAIEIEGAPLHFATAPALTLRWPAWYDTTADERQMDAAALVALITGGVISRETAVKALADEYGVEDVAAELALIEADQAKAQQAQIDLAKATKPPGGPLSA
jgi:hypothetical protein